MNIKLVATVTLKDEQCCVIGPGAVDINITEDRYLFVFNYSVRDIDGENSGLAAVFAPGQWTGVSVQNATLDAA